MKLFGKGMFSQWGPCKHTAVALLQVTVPGLQGTSTPHSEQMFLMYLCTVPRNKEQNLRYKQTEAITTPSMVYHLGNTSHILQKIDNSCFQNYHE